MALVKWSPEYETGNDDIDQDHRSIFALINDLDDKVIVGVSDASIKTTLEALINYVDTHFEREETLMAACGYEELNTHKKMHRQLADHVTLYKDSYDLEPEDFDMDGFMYFLAKWLSDHILLADMDYVSVIRGTVNEARSKK